MSFTDAISQIDQIIQWEQGLSSATALNQTSPTSPTTGTSLTTGTTPTTPTTGTTGTAGVTSTDGTSSTSQSAFAAALAEAQASTESAAATGMLDPTDSTDPTDSSDLLGGGDSQLLTALQSMSSSDPADSTDSTSTTSTADTTSTTGTTSTAAEISALESALGDQSTTAMTTTLPTTTTPTDTTLTATPTETTPTATAASVTVNSDSGPAGGEATSPADPRISAMTEEANALVGKPYVYGGGHSGWGPSNGYDCSGFVSAVVHAGGYLSSPQDTVTLPTASGIESGPGKYVTIYDRDQPGEAGHTIIDINGQFYESGGEHGSWGGGGGVEKISTPSAAYLSTFNDVLHPAGL